MQESQIRAILEQIASGSMNSDEGLERLRHLPYEDIGFAQVDHHRGLRQGQPEVIFGQGKTVGQISTIMQAMAERGSNLLVTRLESEKAHELLRTFPAAQYHCEARCLTVETAPSKPQGKGTILVISAGTSDIPVASEAVITARFLGNQVEQLFDVGVAGIHRLLARVELIRSATVLIVVAGMEGALPSVVGGLVDRPVIAVPTSVGYGASFGGIAALLGMLNSCASGVTVVNIDNGFGAACAASLMNRV
ncbi:nickel pincer cofactor biosynthesis protein LarB [Trichlorobacter sp.]|uniref:nickel pincer cofactor biosynthesis protein LarB n=1 Tax=Trichlorobacter sp. TaxID=2911007 RepID=UPI002A364BC0|nr:nickel pincer cofactor biosynthesis protein LarB [Trichlorobacter sp.]MDY0383277.1 nickel pincer cofactor biosynthesis protein LarB [Trichlorobacter sp.]